MSLFPIESIGQHGREIHFAESEVGCEHPKSFTPASFVKGQGQIFTNVLHALFQVHQSYQCTGRCSASTNHSQLVANDLIILTPNDKGLLLDLHKKFVKHF